MFRFPFGNRISIDDEVKTCANTPNAVLLDVREPDEFAAGHIPGAVNYPLGRIREVANTYPEKDRPYFVYCRSGNRSGMATRQMTQLGYTNAKNIGGIMHYRGPIER